MSRSREEKEAEYWEARREEEEGYRAVGCPDHLLEAARGVQADIDQHPLGLTVLLAGLIKEVRDTSEVKRLGERVRTLEAILVGAVPAEDLRAERARRIALEEAVETALQCRTCYEEDCGWEAGCETLEAALAASKGGGGLRND